MSIEVTFRKSGKEIKEAITNRIKQLESRLETRNKSLSEFMKDKNKLRSYLVRSSLPYWESHSRDGKKTLFGKEEISSEEKEEITQLCKRIFEIEQELHRLSLISIHLVDDQVFDLRFEDLVEYGFEANFYAE